jgi:hypothetical protein
MKDANKFVNNKDFGKIAQSSNGYRGSRTAEQVGNENQREYARLGKLPIASKEAAAKNPQKDWKQSKETRANQRAGGSRNVAAFQNPKNPNPRPGGKPVSK